MVEFFFNIFDFFKNCNLITSTYFSKNEFKTVVSCIEQSCDAELLFNIYPLINLNYWMMLDTGENEVILDSLLHFIHNTISMNML